MLIILHSMLIQGPFQPQESKEHRIKEHQPKDTHAQGKANARQYWEDNLEGYRRPLRVQIVYQQRGQVLPIKYFMAGKGNVVYI